MKRLRLAIVCYPTFGGSGVIATELGRALAGRGHRVHLISTDLPARLQPAERLTFHRVQVVSYPLFEYPPYTLALATKIAGVIRQERLDLVHVHYAIPHSIAAILGQEMASCSVKIVTTLHGTDVQLVGLDPSYWEVTRYGMLHSSGLTAVSRALVESTEHEFHLDSEIRFIPNFVDTRRFRRRRDARRRRTLAAPEEKIVLHVSNYRDVKRSWEVPEIFRRIAAAIPARLYMIGDGPDRRRAEDAVRAFGLEDRAHFVSFTDSVEDWLGVADLLVHPSEMESFGLVPLEAMACGVPVVACRVGGLPEVVTDGETGFLHEVGDVAAMASRGREILDEEDLWTALSRGGEARARQHFAVGKIVPLYERYFREVLTR